MFLYFLIDSNIFFIISRWATCSENHQKASRSTDKSHTFGVALLLIYLNNPNLSHHNCIFVIYKGVTRQLRLTPQSAP